MSTERSPRPPAETGSALRRAARETGWVLGRSLFPFAALALILGTALWGPWVTLGLTLVWWRVVVRFA